MRTFTRTIQFTIFGTTSDAPLTPARPHPEPSSLAPLGSGLTLLATKLRYRAALQKPCQAPEGVEIART